jgi:hypothetical protein
MVKPQHSLGALTGFVCRPLVLTSIRERYPPKYSLQIISDEVYAVPDFPNTKYPDSAPFTSLLSLDTTSMIDPAYVPMTHPLYKDFGAAALKLAH